MKIAKSLPTVFAMNVAKSVGLIPVEQNRSNHEDYEDWKDMLAQFQQLSITGEFEEAMLAYYFVKDSIDEDQQQALQLIHKTTKPWLYGHISSELLAQLSSKMLSGRDKKEISALLLQCMDGETPDGGSEGTVHGLLVRLTNGAKDGS